MTESESVALPLGDTPIYVLNDSALLLYHLMTGLSIHRYIFFYFNFAAHLFAKRCAQAAETKTGIKEQEARVLGASCSFIKDEN